MYLKAIEVQGFKSFAHKIVFQFQSGITGIVGPNGSGKSNVADAVRWVLGEQSAKQLRSSNMQDVIFSGTENRKPQGFAHVAITFDNSDHTLQIEYDEVTVSRRVYRSGESEYRINSSICRLKDIQELFYDTGIGKEGYSIIGQGQIDKILNGKPEERRELFDEAAGIVKFKKRKAIAVKKLESEKQNLLRVNDILNELEKQVGPLEKQAEKARQYLKYKEQLKVLDVNMFLLDGASLKEKLTKVEEDTFIVEGDLLAARQEATRMKERYDALTEKTEELDREIGEKRLLYNELSVAKENQEGRIGILKEQINTDRMNDEHIKRRIAAIEEETKGREAEAEEYAGKRAELKDKLDELMLNRERTRQEASQAEEMIRDLEQTIAAGKEQMIRVLNDKASLAAGKQRYATMLEQSMTRKSEISARLLRTKTEEESQAGILNSYRQEKQEIKDSIRKLEEEQKEAAAVCEQAGGKVRELTRLLNEKQQEYHTLHTKLESLRNLAERYEGYGNSIRRVMEAKKSMPGIIGVVADLIHVEKTYETAIETALGASIQNVVTDSEQTAKHCIEFLKKNKFGRATFLPLSAVKNRGEFGWKQVLKEPGVLGLASELVTADVEYDGLIKYLLGRIVVADTIDHAMVLARKNGYAFRIVTLEGELFNAGGSMTGGAYKNSSNLLGRKRELEELEASMKKALAQYERMQENLKNEEHALASARSHQESLAGAKQEARLKLQAASMNEGQAADKLSEIREGSRDLLLENKQLEEQIGQIRESQEKLNEEEKSLKRRNQGYEDEIAESSGLLAEQKAVQDRIAESLSKIQIELSGLSQQDSFLQENILRIQKEVLKLAAEKNDLKQGILNTGTNIEQKESEIAQIRAQIEENAGRMGVLEEEIRVRIAGKEGYQAEQKEFFDKREELTRRTADLDKESFRLSQQKEKIEDQMERYVEYLWTEYELTPSEAASMRDESCQSIPELKKSVNEQKILIKNLGNVNVNAIEDYKEISERYEFMRTQHGDLVDAADNLSQIIEELDEGMRRQFEEKFREIKQEFDRVFKELFGGGRAALELVEEEEKDILEAGIAIIAQPPGKKLQNMMQLSGGEKALTAISLLFAIQNLKPSPFCLLDEIEAALDDSNVGRFANYLNKLKSNTQFIVITHRRGTMLIADQLYGITMQEKGVSSLVSVDLTDEAKAV